LLPPVGVKQPMKSRLILTRDRFVDPFPVSASKGLLDMSGATRFQSLSIRNGKTNAACTELYGRNSGIESEFFGECMYRLQYHTVPDVTDRSGPLFLTWP
jgi:hypothetical protein